MCIPIRNIPFPYAFGLACLLQSSKASSGILSCQSHFTIQRTDNSPIKLLCVFISVIFQYSPSRGEARFFPIDFLPTPVTFINHHKTLTYFIICFFKNFKRLRDSFMTYVCTVNRALIHRSNKQVSYHLLVNCCEL